MWMWVLRNKEGKMMNMSYKKGAYSHASVFFSENDVKNAVEYFGGTYTYNRVWLDV